MKWFLLLLAVMGCLLVLWWIIEIFFAILGAIGGAILLGAETTTNWMLHGEGDVIRKILAFPFWIILAILATMCEFIACLLAGLVVYQAARMARDWWWRGKKD